jgi:hypothetical protein
VVKNALVVFPDGNHRCFVTLWLTQSSLCVPLLALRLCVKESVSKNRVSGYSCFQIVLRSRLVSVPAAPHLQVLDAPPSSSFSSSSSSSLAAPKRSGGGSRCCGLLHPCC